VSVPQDGSEGLNQSLSPASQAILAVEGDGLDVRPACGRALRLVRTAGDLMENLIGLAEAVCLARGLLHGVELAFQPPWERVTLGADCL